MNKVSEILTVCSPFMSPYLIGEMQNLGFVINASDKLAVSTTGTFADAMKLNLHLRTGNRVLFLIERFEAKNAEDLYRHAVNMEWDEWFDKNSYLHIHSSVKNDTIKDNRFANLKLKDAIADFFRKKYNARPDAGPLKDRSVIFLHWKNSEAGIYLDTSGETIAKHGYKANPWKAPMIEALAAGVIMETGWKSGNFLNPMCGSGTLAIEAAMMGCGKAPGLLRDNFGFMHCKLFDSRTWEKLLAEARAKVKRRVAAQIIATDRDSRAIDASLINAGKAGVAGHIDFIKCDFKLSPVPEGEGIVILNPEYGSRMGEISQLELTYKEIGDFLKKKCKGYAGYVFTGNPDLAKKIGLRTAKKAPFMNGPIECRLLKYELYEGSRKPKSD